MLTHKSARYQRLFRRLQQATYLLPIMLLVVTVIISPFVKALPGDYTWTKAGVSGISGDRASWAAVASSADGTKLVAAGMYSGSIYTSTDSGATWLERTEAGTHSWQSLASSADGAKLVAAEAGGFIYTSTDSGATWTVQAAAGERSWLSVVSSADGTKLAAAEKDGSIYTSTDSGVTWLERTGAGSRSWQSLASSSDGTKLVAAELAYYDDTALSFVGSIYTSTDSGVTWTVQTAAGERSWISVASSSDGTKLAAVEQHYDDAVQTFIGSVYTSTDSGATWTAQAAAGEYRWASLAIASTTAQLFAITDTGTIRASSDFGITWEERITNGPVFSVVGSASGAKLTGIGNGSIYTSTDSGVTWVARTIVGARAWYSIASSADGTKLAAVTNGYVDAYIYTSTDSGATWVERTSAGSKHWYQITSSLNGTKLAALGNNSIYTSADSGATWTEQTAAGTHYWQSITSSADGTKLAAVTSDGFIYTSADSGATWTEQVSNGSVQWQSITSSADGTKLAAVEVHYDEIKGTNTGSLYTSTDSGATWTERTAAGVREWRAIASSADGTKLAVTEAHFDESTSTDSGSVYVSTDSGATWTERATTGGNQYQYIASSADGTKLAVVISGDGIYTSIDSGVTWIKQAGIGVHDWRSIAMSANGTKLVTPVVNGSIYLATMEEGGNSGGHTISFDYATLGSSEQSIVANAVLTATSSTCNTIDTSKTLVVGSSNVRAPVANVSILGGIGYALGCTSSGGSADATITLGTYYSDLTKLRIYKKSASSSVLTDITSQVTLTNTTDTSHTPITTLSYTLVDGGEYDEDGAANGMIVDPIYIGIVSTSTGGSVETLAPTGENQGPPVVSGIIALSLAAGLLRYRKTIYN